MAPHDAQAGMLFLPGWVRWFAHKGPVYGDRLSPEVTLEKRRHVREQLAGCRSAIAPDTEAVGFFWIGDHFHFFSRCPELRDKNLVVEPVDGSKAVDGTRVIAVKDEDGARDSPNFVARKLPELRSEITLVIVGENERVTAVKLRPFPG